MKTNDKNPVEQGIIKSEDETPLDETGADHIGSNNTDENSEGRKEGKSYYEKLRELDEKEHSEQDHIVVKKKD
jgi:hypothetical protein